MAAKAPLVLAMLSMPQAVAAALQKAAATEAVDSRPVMKVVRLLEDMRVELQKELDDDKAVHETLACWCKTNTREKTQAIEIGESRSSQLESTMAEALAKIQELKEKRKSIMEELNADIASKQQADSLRMKENQEFHDIETDMLAAIQSIKQAVVVLSKHNTADFAQMKSVAHSLQSAKVAQLALSAKILKPEQLSLLKDFLSQVEGGAPSTGASFLSVPIDSYSPASGQIFGVLKQMQEEFEANLAEKQKAEQQAVADYEELKAAKDEEIATGKKTQTEIDSDLAKFTEKHALAVQELEETQAQLKLDKEFLATLTKKCSESEEEFEARLKSRTDEMVAVDDTIKILNSDEAFANFGKTVSDPDTAGFVAGTASSFLQTSSNSEESARLERTITALRKLAFSRKSPKVALVADAMKLDSFKEVLVLIDKMIAELGTQQSDEVAHRDFCKEDMAKNDRDTAKSTDHKEKLETTIADTEKTIKTLTADIKASQEEVDEMNLQMKRASETREGENLDFQTTVTDQRMTQTILQKAMDRLMETYAATELKTRKLTQGAMLQEDQPGAPHIQTSGTHTDPGNGPARFDEYEQNAGGKRVIALLEEVLTESKKTEDEAMRSETDGQQFYENFMKDSNKSIKEHLEAISSMSEAKAKAEMDLGMYKTDLKATDTELENLAGLMGELHQSCDFILQNFDARQEARAAEQDALREAKAILGGQQ